MPNPLVDVQHHGDRLVVINTNSARRNALTLEYYAGLREALQQAATDPAIKAVILTGEGSFFCAGGNLNVLKERIKLSLDERKASIENLHSLIRLMRSCPKPLIAAVEGGAAGAGVSLVFACDLIVAAEQSLFTVAYVKAGLVPDGGLTALLNHNVPAALAAEMCLLGEPIGAERLFALGAINRLCAPGTALDTAHALAERLARGPSLAIGRIKALLVSAQHTPLDEQLDRERDAMAEALGGAEAQEGTHAFLEKRTPVFP